MRKTLLTSLLLALFAFALPAQATVVEPMNLQKICDLAHSAFHGTCVSAQSHVDAARHVVMTTYEFRVTEWLKGGDGSASVFVTHVGGEADGIGTHVCGVPEYKVGEEVVLFLNEPHPTTGCSLPMGLTQGVFHVKGSASGGRAVYRNYAGLVFWNPATGKATQPPEELQGEQSLADFLSSVRSKVANPTTQK